ncbi:MAG: RNA-binding protein, partial [Hyphomicrobiales bacterium]|nr:RNA-binding protein [Hyphomicrobiales bacterium]
GKNREIKRVLEHLGLSVNRLIRVSFGPFELGDLGEGEVEEVRTRVLRDQLGPKLAKEAGVNFDAESVDHAPPPPAERRPPPRGERADRPRPDRRRPEREGFSDRMPARGALEPEPAKAPPRKRKHVTALRAEVEAEEASGPRRRIERGATSDRKGREVKVERIMVARPERPARGEGRRFGDQARRSEGRSFESRGASGEGRAPPRERKPYGDRPPRGEGRPSSRGEGRSFESRGASGEGRAPSREGKPFGKRPPSGEGRFSPRGEGKPYEKRGASGEGRASRGGGKPFAGRSQAGEGRAPSRPGGKPPGKRPTGGGGAPTGKRPPRRS